MKKNIPKKSKMQKSQSAKSLTYKIEKSCELWNTIEKTILNYF